MSVSIDVTNALSSTIGKKDGVTQEELKALQKKVSAVHQELVKKRQDKIIGFYDLPYDKNIVQIIKAITQVVRRKFEFFIHIGIGGSCLGPQTLCSAIMHQFHCFREKRHMIPNFIFLDNPDPNTITDLLDIINLNTSSFFVVSKSGETDETLAIFMILYHRVLKRLGSTQVGEHFVVATTLQNHRTLLSIAEKEKLRVLPLPENVGGRYSAFTAAGIYPAAVAGANIDSLLEGAAKMDKRTSTDNIEANPAYLNAAIHYLLDTNHQKDISVMMPYCNALWHFSRWYQQLWAESLGKQKDKTGIGQTPLASLGTVDQHSLLQLLLDGPNDKVITLVRLKEFNKDIKIPDVFRNISGVDHLRNQDLSQVILSECKATEYVLTKHQRPNVRITLDTLDEFHMGELLYMFEVQTAMAGGLYGINPFDQPAVEEGKIVARALLGKKQGLDKNLEKEIQQFIKKSK